MAHDLDMELDADFRCDGCEHNKDPGARLPESFHQGSVIEYTSNYGLDTTLAFSAVTAGVSIVLNYPLPGILLTLVGYFGLLFGISHFHNSALGLVLVFALTGLMGVILVPILNSYTFVAFNTRIF